MMRFYASPGASSLASHIALEESGLPYALVTVNARTGETQSETYARINPFRRVPALEIEDGVLTENIAILSYLAGRAPEARLLPAPGSLAHARAQEWLSLCASTLHVAYRPIFRNVRFAETAEARAEVMRLGLDTLVETLQLVDERLAGRRYALGDDYSLCDSYLLVFYSWTRRDPVASRCPPLLNWDAHARRVCERPAVRRAFEQEGLPLF
jgi:glutathione S-transferase